MNKVSVNPFLNRNKVTNPDEFFGRERELDIIVKNLTYPEPQSVEVIGERRSGKSSLITRVYQAFSKRECNIWERISGQLNNPDRFVCVLLDLAEITADNAEEFTHVIIDELVTENSSLARFVHRYPPMDNEKLPPRHPQTILKNLLKYACAEDYRFVFLLDEFELLTHNLRLKDSQYLYYLRGISDNYALAYVTSSRQPLDEITQINDEGGSPFDNNFSHPIELGLLRENECQQLIKGVLELYDYDPNIFGDTEIKEVIKLAGRHPYYLKIACANLFEWAVNGGKEPDSIWKNQFQEQAGEEFDRLWHNALTQKEKYWILQSYQEENIRIEDVDGCKELNSLVSRGILLKQKDGVIAPFSEGFKSYIKDYIKTLENRVEAIETDILSGYKKLYELDEISQICDSLANIRKQWQERELCSTDRHEQAVFSRCEKLFKILDEFRNLQQALNSSDMIKQKTSFTCRLTYPGEKALDAICSYFDNHEFFAENRPDALDVTMGLIILNHIVEYLKTAEKHHLFGNGFDKVLAARINFMKNHGEGNKFHEFNDIVTRTFDRFISVYDYARASEILKPRLNRFTEWLSKYFFRHPVRTIAGLVFIPLYILAAIDLHPNSEYLLPIGLVVAAALYGSLLWTIYRTTFFEKYCKIPDSTKLAKKLNFWSPIAFQGLLIGSIISDLLSENNSYINRLSAKTDIILIVGFAVAVIAFVIRVAKIRTQVLDCYTAVKRASYFIFVEYFKAFCLFFVFYAMLIIVAYLYTKITRTSDTIVLFDDSYLDLKPWSKHWYFLKPVSLTDNVWLNIRLILALSFVAPFATIFTFVKEHCAHPDKSI